MRILGTREEGSGVDRVKVLLLLNVGDVKRANIGGSGIFHF